jgi:hypothetical protein
MKTSYSPHLVLAKKYWSDLLQKEDLAIDATCGNGHDTLFLSKLCSVIGLDIQPQALQNTEILLQKHQQKAILHQLSHTEIDSLSLPSPPRLIVYNLGYLPGANKSLTTQTESTLISVKKSLSMLKEGGALSITCYPGHEEGAHEERALEDWIKSLPWCVSHHKWLERSRSPSLIWILKSLKDNFTHPGAA